MSPAAGRGAVALATILACAGALGALRGRGPAVEAPAAARLGEIEASLARGARLHPEVPLPRPRGTGAYCAECHPPVAHPGRNAVAAMLNAHAVRISCLGCHWPAEGGARPAVRWVTSPGEGTVASVLPPERATREDLARLRSAVVVRRVCFERGPACGGCHRPGGMAPWARPGSSATSGARLERVDTVFTLAPGEKWYFPQFP